MKRVLSVLLMSAAFVCAFAAKVDTVSVATDNLETPMTILVVTPDDIKPDTKLPTVYTLHGYSGDWRDWLSHQPRIKDMADRYGMIIVCPDGRNSWYMDSPVNPKVKMESFFVNDLVTYIDSHYPSIPDPKKRAITGLSMGGHGALYLAFRHPDIWGNAGSMSGGVDIRPFPNNWELPNIPGPEDKYPERWNEAAAINHIKDIKPGQVNIYFDCGIDDFFAEVNDNLHKELVKAGIPHDYVSRPGAHTWQYWNNSILHHLLFFSEAFGQ